MSEVVYRSVMAMSTERQLAPDQRSFIAREVRLGIPLDWLATQWDTTEGHLLRLAGLTRNEYEQRNTARRRLLRKHPELADLNRAVVAEFADA